jgi:sugar phosphate isomerase/epimerase
MGVAIGIDHLTLLDVSPPDLVGIASGAGFDTVGLRVAPAGPGEEPWPMAAGSPMLKETLGRLADTGVRVLAIETLQLHPDTRPGDYQPILEVGAQLDARFVNLMIYDDDLERVSEAFAAVTADALAYGLRPLVEAITYMPVRDLEAAVRIAEGSGGGGVLMDSLHFQRHGGDLRHLRSIDPGLFSYVQLSDGPRQAPTGLPRPDRLPRGQSPGHSDLQLESRAMRLLPGDGELPLVEFLAALPAGLPVSVEAPCLPLRRELAPDEFARHARKGVARIRSAKVRP